MEKIYSYKEALKETIEYFNGDNLAAEVFLGKYALRNNEGELVEKSPTQLHKRLAKEFARIEKKYPNPISEEKLFNLMDKFKFIVPQGSPMAGIGNKYKALSLSNCYVIEEPNDSYSGILYSDTQLANLMKRRAGVGISLSKLRPKDLPVQNAAGTTTGISTFMERYSNTTREVGQSGRRGALIETISIHHPEIETFINIKKDLKKVTGANISIQFTDEFLNAVISDTEYELRWPVDAKEPKTSKFVNAKDIWNKFIEAAWQSAEPGALFWDTALRLNPADCYEKFGFKTISVNPCLTDDTWIMTKQGPRQIKQLIDKNFTALVNGNGYNATGFYKTGNKKVYKIKTQKGFEIKGTANHKILTTDGWVEIKDLNEEQNIILQKHDNFEWGGEGTFEEGWLVGEMVGDGCYNPNNYTGLVSFWGSTRFVLAEKAKKYVKNLDYKFRSDFTGGLRENKELEKITITSRALDKLAERFISKKDKNLCSTVELSSSDFYKGFLRGLFDADGSVQGNLIKGISIRLSQNNLDRLKIVQRMLLRLGIVSTIYENRINERYKKLPDGKGGYKEYFCKSGHELCVTNEMFDLFINRVGFEDTNKQQKAIEIIKNRKRNANKSNFITKVISVEELCYEDVYDCTVENVHMFDANGMTVHNCGEILLSSAEACRLLLINTYSYVNDPFTKKASFDFELFAKHAIIGQRLMDDIVDLELECIDNIIAKVENDPEPLVVKQIELDLWKTIRKNCENGRRTGLGTTAIGDTLAALGITYGSEESIKVTEEIYKCLAVNSYKSSVIMASERGTFPVYDYDLEKDHPFINRIMDEDKELKEMWVKYGRRNIANLTTAPAGSVSLLTQTTSGIEPAFLLSYMRRKKINPNDEHSRVDFTDELGDKWQEYKVYHHGFKKWMEVNNKLDKDMEQSPYFGATSNDVDWMASVKLQAAAQKWIDHSISKTCNLPADTTKEKVSEIYLSAWEHGCKGFTIYRDGSRAGVLVSDKKDENKSIDNTKPETIQENHAPRRPEKLACDIYNMQVRGEKWSFFVGLLNDKPYEIFAGRSKHIHLPKSRKHGFIKKNGVYNLYTGEGDHELVIHDLASVFENATESAFTRTLSLALRHGAPVQYIVEQLEKGANVENDMFSLSKGLMRVLKNYIKDGTKISSKKCPNCKAEGTLIYQESCLLCTSCGYTKCS